MVCALNDDIPSINIDNETFVGIPKTAKIAYML